MKKEKKIKRKNVLSVVNVAFHDLLVYCPRGIDNRDPTYVQQQEFKATTDKAKQQRGEGRNDRPNDKIF